ncbi:MAG: hypothetical protein K8S21_11120 [Gemmatimonadetes bacterium]|nr:hypothetical protein [Gemmatimonadota bacterium]
MTISRKRRTLLVAAVMLTAIPIGGAAPYNLRARCELALSWMEAHANALPNTFEQLASLPVVYQRAVLTGLSVEDRVAVLKAHIQSFTESVGTLTPLQVETRARLVDPLNDAQIAFLRDVVDQLPALNSQSDPVGVVFLRHTRLKAQADRLFPRDVYDVVLDRVGPYRTASEEAVVAEAFDKSSRFAGEALLGRISGVFSDLRATVTESTDCNCDANGDCIANYYCLQTSPPCSEVNTCYTTLMAKCNGRCQYNAELQGPPEEDPPSDPSSTVLVPSIVPMKTSNPAPRTH